MLRAVGGVAFLGDGIVIGTALIALRPGTAESNGNTALGGLSLQLIPHPVVGGHIRQSGGVQAVQRGANPFRLPGMIPHEIAVEIKERALGIQ